MKRLRGKNSYLALSVLYLVLSGFVSVTQAEVSFSRIVIFGDSLSDSGNLAAATTNFPFPYYRNRISNGPVAVDFFTQAFGLNANASRHLVGDINGDNFAVSGGNIIGDSPQDLAPQVSAFLERPQSSIENTLFVFFIGGNDVRDISQQASATIRGQKVNELGDVLAAQVDRVIAAGAAYVMLVNVPNIGRVPESASRDASNSGYIARATQTSNDVNNEIIGVANRVAQRAVQTRVADIYSAVEAIFASASVYGFTNTSDGCFADFSFHRDCVFGTRFDRFMFFDNLHPSSKSHELIAGTLISTARQFQSVSSSPRFNPAIIELLLSD